MVTTSDLAKSISTMSREEMEKRLLEIRKNIREPKKEIKLKAATKVKVKQPAPSKDELAKLVGSMSQEDKMKLLEALGGL